MEGKQGVLWYFLEKKGELHRNEKLEPLLRSTGKPWGTFCKQSMDENNDQSTV